VPNKRQLEDSPRTTKPNLDQLGSSILVTPHVSVNVVKHLQNPNQKAILAKEIFDDIK